MQKEYDASSIDFTDNDQRLYFITNRLIRRYGYCQSVHMTPEQISGGGSSGEVFWQKIKLSKDNNDYFIYCNLCVKIDFNETKDIKIYMSI